MSSQKEVFEPYYIISNNATLTGSSLLRLLVRGLSINEDPCIDGAFHYNAAIFLVSQIVLVGMQGCTTATSASVQGGSILTLLGDANTHAFGNRVQNCCDFFMCQMLILKPTSIKSSN